MNDITVIGDRGEPLGWVEADGQGERYYVEIMRAGVACAAVIDGKLFELDSQCQVARGDTIKVEFPK